MAIHFDCPWCIQTISVDESKARARIECPHCNRPVKVPKPTHEPPPSLPESSLACSADTPAPAPDASERQSMTESLSLGRCKPLSDPVRVFANIVPIWAIIAFLAIILLIAGRERIVGEGIVIVSFFTLLSALSMPLGIWLLFRTANRKPVIYLRAFRSDRPARRLRSLLKAALGSDFRLCGIRPPRERSHLLTRLLATNLVIFRYAGSESFELEADDRDWMVRLLSTYARSAFVFVDLRDLTQ